MKLVTLYGAPGEGKLTTASALAELTGFKLFHNHLTFDLVRSLFDSPSAPFGNLAERIRLSAFEAAADAGLTGVIFTSRTVMLQRTSNACAHLTASATAR